MNYNKEAKKRNTKKNKKSNITQNKAYQPPPLSRSPPDSNISFRVPALLLKDTHHATQPLVGDFLHRSRNKGGNAPGLDKKGTGLSQ